MARGISKRTLATLVMVVSIIMYTACIAGNFLFRIRTKYFVFKSSYSSGYIDVEPIVVEYFHDALQYKYANISTIISITRYNYTHGAWDSLCNAPISDDN